VGTNFLDCNGRTYTLVTFDTIELSMNNNPSAFHILKGKIEERHQEIKDTLATKHKDAFEWLATNTAQLAAGAMSGVMLLSAPVMPMLSSGGADSSQQQFLDIKENIFLVGQLDSVLPKDNFDLSINQENEIARILTENYKLTVEPSIDGKRLQNTYGLIGAEQHLMRYAGDSMESHFKTPEENILVGKSGMAPGRGAFGYFANSQDTMTQEEIDKEKYYIAVQTFLVPEYSQNTREYRDFFKFHKMLVVNPQNGRAVVAVIGDAGPAKWTGKHLGGSPEIMKHLERVDGRSRGTVLYFFIDDPENKIPLGPIDPKSNV